tara:strand:+ start:3069 stop:3782 length:714 start_codon:yes stop_codon:yes gene_type:complete
MTETKGKLAVRIAAARKVLGMSQTELSELIGVGQRTISDLERGRVAHTAEWRKIAETLGIPAEEYRQLMLEARRDSGKVTRLPADVREALKRASTELRSPRAANDDGRIPVMGQAVAGDDGRFLFNGDVIDWVPAPPALAGVPNAYAVYVSGVSMEPRFRQGETVWIHPSKPPKPGDSVVVQIAAERDGEAPAGYIKQFEGWTGDALNLSQHNPAKALTFDRDRVLSVHTVVGVQIA